jgi:hypothetical protein
MTNNAWHSVYMFTNAHDAIGVEQHSCSGHIYIIVGWRLHNDAQADI